MPFSEFELARPTRSDFSVYDFVFGAEKIFYWACWSLKVIIFQLKDPWDLRGIQGIIGSLGNCVSCLFPQIDLWDLFGECLERRCSFEGYLLLPSVARV